MFKDLKKSALISSILLLISNVFLVISSVFILLPLFVLLVDKNRTDNIPLYLIILSLIILITYIAVLVFNLFFYIKTVILSIKLGLTVEAVFLIVGFFLPVFLLVGYILIFVKKESDLDLSQQVKVEEVDQTEYI